MSSENENKLNFEMPENPETIENIRRRGQKLKMQIKEIEKSARRLTQTEMMKIEFRPLDFSDSHIDFEEYFKDI